MEDGAEVSVAGAELVLFTTLEKAQTVHVGTGEHALPERLEMDVLTCRVEGRGAPIPDCW